ncbi:MAG: RNA polymerase sigma factor [Patescibacteria group bacterium]
MTDQELVYQTLHHDKELFVQLVERYQKPILAYCSRLLNYNQVNAEDVASSAFLKAYSSLASYNPRLKFSSWIYRIAHNEAVNFIKANAKHFSFDPQDSYFHNFFQPHQDLKLTIEELGVILNKLTLPDKNLLVLFYFEELSIFEISEILKTSENSVKSRLSQARKKARKLLDI